MNEEIIGTVKNILEELATLKKKVESVKKLTDELNIETNLKIEKLQQYAILIEDISRISQVSSSVTEKSTNNSIYKPTNRSQDFDDSDILEPQVKLELNESKEQTLAFENAGNYLYLADDVKVEAYENEERDQAAVYPSFTRWRNEGAGDVCVDLDPPGSGNVCPDLDPSGSSGNMGPDLDLEMEVNDESSLARESADKVELQEAFLCDICKLSFTQLSTFIEHRKEHRKRRDKPYPCHMCEKSFRHGHTLHFHILFHLGKIKVYNCEICSKSFEREEYLKKHMETHSSVRHFSCEVCGNIFKSETLLKTHFEDKHKENMIVENGIIDATSSCQKTPVVNNRMISVKSHSNEKRHPCSKCGKRFKNELSLKVHATVAHPDKPLPLPDKPESAIEKPFSCNFCDKAFRKEMNLNEHLKSHTDL